MHAADFSSDWVFSLEDANRPVGCSGTLLARFSLTWLTGWMQGDVVLGKLEELVQFLIKEMGQDLYRYKGVLSVAGKDEKFVFQGRWTQRGQSQISLRQSWPLLAP